MTLKSDYRGHGASEGVARGGYNDPGYTVDMLNAAASLKKDRRVNRKRMGVWGHSMGGQLGLRAMLVDRDLRAGCLCAGVVAGYDVLATDWNRLPGTRTGALDPLNRRYLRAMSPNAFLEELNGRPTEPHHGTADKEVRATSAPVGSSLWRLPDPLRRFKRRDEHGVLWAIAAAFRSARLIFTGTVPAGGPTSPFGPPPRGSRARARGPTVRIKKEPSR
ncbi:alpha/beta hydrolase family protein [Deinococcus hopiensis]|uniref:alpha/beta hydrolase family protein n=1 Tax=Deinococcus hopiensis TaxID=309885 RepID=UPI0026BA88D4